MPPPAVTFPREARYCPRMAAGWNELSAEFALEGPWGLLALDGDGFIVWANAAACSYLGRTGDELAKIVIADLIHPDDRARTTAAARSITAGGTDPSKANITTRGTVYRMLRPDGSSLEIFAEGRVGFLLDRAVWQMGFLPAPPRLTVLAAVQGVAAGAPLHDTFQMLTDAIIEATEGNGGIGIRWIDSDGRAHLYGDLDPMLGGLTDTGAPDHAPGSPWREAGETGKAARRTSLDELAPKVAAAAMASNFAGCCVSPVSDPATGLALLYFTWVRHESQLDYVEQTFHDILADVLDIALQRAHDHAQLIFAAKYDQLTGLPNRGVFFAALDDALERGPVSVLYLDLDGFKDVNDGLGHHAGDLVLPAVAHRLRSCVDASATVARLGGDEFAIVWPMSAKDQVEDLADRLVHEINKPIQIVGHGEVSVGVSVGIAMTDAAGITDPDELVVMADVALRCAKRQGKGQWVIA